jgi:hypothetical protein
LLGITPAQNLLKGQWVDMTAPGIAGGYKSAGQASSASHDYIYPCNDDRFEEVNTYYHLDRTQRAIQALGFSAGSGILNRPLSAHAHYFSGCNAFFDPINGGVHFGDFDGPPESCFGPSPAPGPPLYDSGEDADVVIHEYGHAIHDNQVPGWSFGPYPAAEQAGSMGEGFGDFLAGVMNNDPCIGEYITFNELSCGGSPGLRSLEIAGTYPGMFESCPDVDYNGDTVPETEEPHCGGLVWGAALWDLVQAIGGGSATQQARDTGLELVLEGQFFLDQTATFQEAAAAICMADTLLFGGANSASISAAFGGRGISTAPCSNTDFASSYIRVRHTYSGDLDVNIKIGPNVNVGGPSACTLNLGDPDIALGFVDWYVQYDLPGACAGFLPPTTGQPWWLEVRDGFAQDVGSIQAFEILLVGGQRCYSTNTPIAIPDGAAFSPPPVYGATVYAKIDCTAKVSAPTPTPGPTPGPNSFGNVDCQGGVSSIDALKIQRHNASLSVSQSEPCENIETEVLPNGELQGDVDCSNGVDAIDALKLLRHTASLPVSQNQPCPVIGT